MRIPFAGDIKSNNTILGYLWCGVTCASHHRIQGRVARSVQSLPCRWTSETRWPSSPGADEPRRAARCDGVRGPRPLVCVDKPTQSLGSARVGLPATGTYEPHSIRRERGSTEGNAPGTQQRGCGPGQSVEWLAPVRCLSRISLTELL